MNLEDSRGSQNLQQSIRKPRHPVPPIQLSQQSQPAGIDAEGRTAGFGGTSSGAEGQTTGQDTLCPSLVVPSGTEFVFAVQEVINTERQDFSFNIVDLKG